MKFLKLIVLLALFVPRFGDAFQQSNSFGYGTPFNSYMTAVATGPVAITTLTGAFRFYCNNTTGTAATLTITDTAGTAFVSSFSIPSNSNVTFPPAAFYIKMVGIKASSGTNNAINCLFEGYTP